MSLSWPQVPFANRWAGVAGCGPDRLVAPVVAVVRAAVKAAGLVVGEALPVEATQAP